MKIRIQQFRSYSLLAGVALMLMLGACGDDTTGPPVHRTESGLEYIDYVVGTGEVAEPGDTVSVHYTARKADGTKFDSTLDNGRLPFQFVLGGGHVISGFDEGVRYMRVGGQRRLIIPADLAYGDRGIPGLVPPGGSVIFDVNLVAVLRPQARAATP